MAVPTITSLTPSTGPAAGGQMVTVVGTGFKVPVLDYNIPTPTISPTVSVTFNGRPARRVEVISATELRVLTPRYWHRDPRADAYAAVSLVVTNLNPTTGLPVTGETVTRASSYTYKRWELGAPRPDPPTSRILKELMQALAVEVERNTYRSTHIEYGEEGTAVIIDEAKLPSINCTLTIQQDHEYAHGRDSYPEEVELADGTFDHYEGVRTVQLLVDLLLAGGTAGEAEHLCQAVQDFVQVNPLLDCAADPEVYDAGEEDQHPVEIWRDPQQVSQPGNSGMVVFSMQLRVRGIRTMPDDPTRNLQPIETITMTDRHTDADTGEDDGPATTVDIVVAP